MPAYAPARVRFWRYVRKTETCWLWTGGSFNHGYGLFGGERTRGVKPKLWVAHRFAWETLRGPIPEGMVLDHKCGVRRCVNPDHLEPITFFENLRRGKQTMVGVSDYGDYPEYPPDSLFG